ncbi:type I phosphomannose isomerase catalytic subunit [Parafannyhessea umbonata]|uniref:type I phosphomannose isomerase catalytic subunit n=1 Tax=Parafannyhessea umbonata TaxID=604330 RepID=UPI003F9E84C2
MEKSAGTKPQELLLPRPVFHNKIWGGRYLHDEYGYDIPDGDVGECWAISAHPNGDCTIEGGSFDGKSLSWLWEHEHELFGDAKGDRFPLLIKILDARQNLSVQVHPDDAYAAKHENGSLGKRECWYVLDCKPGATIVVGQRAKDREQFARMVREGRWDDLLYSVPIKPGDFFMIEPGTIHAIQAGTVVLETQQSSDVTYRVYDYDRVQADGTRRELHIPQTLDVVDFDLPLPKSGDVAAPEKDGVTVLGACPNFEVERVRVVPGSPARVPQTHDFMCVSVVYGTGGKVTSGAGSWELALGSHFVAPAGSGDLEFEGQMELIVSWPEG